MDCHTDTNRELHQDIDQPLQRFFSLDANDLKLSWQKKKDTLSVFWKKHANYLILKPSLEAIIIFHPIPRYYSQSEKGWPMSSNALDTLWFITYIVTSAKARYIWQGYYICPACFFLFLPLHGYHFNSILKTNCKIKKPDSHLWTTYESVALVHDLCAGCLSGSVSSCSCLPSSGFAAQGLSFPESQYPSLSKIRKYLKACTARTRMLGSHRSWSQFLHQWNHDKGVSESGGREPKQVSRLLPACSSFLYWITAPRTPCSAVYDVGREFKNWFSLSMWFLRQDLSHYFYFCAFFSRYLVCKLPIDCVYNYKHAQEWWGCKCASSLLQTAF